MRNARRTVGLLVVSASLLPAQERACDGPPRSVAVTLVTASGTRVSDAAIEVRRVQRRTLVRAARSRGDGSYEVLTDGALTDLRPGGEPFDITFRRHDRLRRVRLIIGLDAARCHVTLKGGRTRVRL